MESKDITRIISIPIALIQVDPFSERKEFSGSSLLSLADSIRNCGLIQPITVRRIPGGEGYELVSGERRLRACSLLEMKEIPAIVLNAGEKESFLIRMIENLQRHDLNYIEEAEGYYAILYNRQMTQDELARRLGKSQSAISNKLRILKLSPQLRRLIRENNISERHARILLKTTDNSLRMTLLDEMIKQKYNVQQSEERLEALVSEEREDLPLGKSQKALIKDHSSRVKCAITDIGIFANTVKECIDTMKNSGVKAMAAQRDTKEYLEFVVRIPKKENKII